MRKIFTILILTFIILGTGFTDLTAQMKPIQNNTENKYGEVSINQLNSPAQSLIVDESYMNRDLNLRFIPVSSPFTFQPDLHFIVKEEDIQSMPIWIEGNLTERGLGRRDKARLEPLEMLEQILPERVQIQSSFDIIEFENDEFGQEHFRFRQFANGIPVFGGDSRLHIHEDGKFIFNGRVYEVPDDYAIEIKITESNSHTIIENDFRENDTYVIPASDWDNSLIGLQYTNTLVWWPFEETGPQLVWHVIANPNYARQWNYFVCVHSGNIIYKYSINGFIPDEILEYVRKTRSYPDNHINDDLATGTSEDINNNYRNDGPATATALDLDNNNILLNTYRQNNQYFLVDASKDMYVNGSIEAGSPKGVIYTFNANRTSPYNGTIAFSPYTSSNNTWTIREAVSTHNYSSVTYNYLKNTFGRTSLDNQGRNMRAIINYTDGQGKDEDNAMWHPGFQAIFMGGGTEILFRRHSSACLDVIGHEYGHGVIEYTAGLIYRNQSGALNESYADIFGTLIEGKNWTMAGDCLNPNLYTSGAMRDLSNPHNGAAFGDYFRGWQPAHVNEMYIGPENNGGVHRNSSIGSFVFYKVATRTSIEIAAAIFYRALTVYLTQSSEFIDFRKAIVQSALDIHGEGEVVNIVRTACNEVGILDGQGNNPTADLQVNPGQDLIALTDVNQSAIYIADGQGNLIANPLYNIGIKSRISFTDNGQYGVFVGSDSKIYLLSFNYNTGQVDLSILIDDPIFRNVIVSKDGSHIAMLTEELNDRIFVYSFINQQFQEFRAYNYTTAPGSPPIYSVRFVDAMEWDYSGEYILYDALNNHGQGYESWDIGVMHVWDKNLNNFAAGQVVKLFDDIAPGISIGNPTISKNSPYIIAFDYLNEFTNQFSILGFNFETRELGKIVDNVVIGFPSYSREDNKIIFDALATNGANVLASVNLGTNKITSTGNATVFINGGSWGVWYANGFRILSNTEDYEIENNLEVSISPNPVSEVLQIKLEGWESGRQLNIEIFNTTGMRMFQKTIYPSHNETNINLSEMNIPSGIYFIKLGTDTGLFSAKRFIKM